MAWTGKVINSNGDVVYTESVTLVATGRAFTSDINPLVKGLSPAGTRYITLTCSADTISGTNLDVALVGSNTGAAGATLATGFELLDAVVADMTADATQYSSSTPVNLALYPAAYRYFAFLVDADEAVNTVTATLFVPHV